MMSTKVYIVTVIVVALLGHCYGTKHLVLWHTTATVVSIHTRCFILMQPRRCCWFASLLLFYLSVIIHETMRRCSIIEHS